MGLSVLPGEERDERIKALVASCRQVAEASGGPQHAEHDRRADAEGAEDEAADKQNPERRRGNEGSDGR